MTSGGEGGEAELVLVDRFPNDIILQPDHTTDMSSQLTATHFIQP